MERGGIVLNLVSDNGVFGRVIITRHNESEYRLMLYTFQNTPVSFYGMYTMDLGIQDGPYIMSFEIVSRISKEFVGSASTKDSLDLSLNVTFDPRTSNEKLIESIVSYSIYSFLMQYQDQIHTPDAEKIPDWREWLDIRFGNNAEDVIKNYIE